MADEQDQQTQDTQTQLQDTPDAPDTQTPAAAVEDALKPTVAIEDIGPARKRLTIEIDSDQINKRIEKNYAQLNTDAQIPGFRKGHVPRRLIERRFSASVREDVCAQLISEAYTVAIEQEKLDVIGEPDVQDQDNIKLQETGPLSFVVEVEVAPQVTLPALEELAIEKVKFEVTDKDVADEIENLRTRFGKPQTVEGGAIEKGDYVLTNVHVLAGENAAEGAEVLAHHHDIYALVHGEDQEFRGHVAGFLVPDLGKQLTGRKPGDELHISMTGPVGHEDEKIRNAPITLHLSLQKIERVIPEEIDKLPAHVGFANVEEMNKQLKQWISDRREREQQAATHKQVQDQLLEKITLDLPEGMTGRQSQRILHRQAMQMAYTGATEEVIATKLAEMRTTSEDQARRELKLFFIIDKAAKDLNIEVSENEINGRIAMIAMQQGRRPEKLRQEMSRNGEIESLYLSVREHKTLEAIVAKAAVKEVDAPAPAAAEPAAAAKPKKKKAK